MQPLKKEFGSKTLTLVLDGSATVDIEKRLGQSLFGIMMTGNGGMKMPRLGEMLVILHGANQTHGIKLEDMPKLYDEFVAKGGDMMKLFEIIQELLEKAGFFGSEVTGNTDLIGEKDEEESMNSLV